MKIADWQELEKKLIWIYRGVPQGVQGTYEHPFLSAWLIEEGQVTLQGKSGQRTLEAGHWVLPPLRHDTRRFSKDARIISVSFTLCWPNGRMLFESSKTTAFLSQTYPELERAARQLLETVSAYFPEPQQNLKWHDAELSSYLAVERVFSDWIEAYVKIMQTLGQKIQQFNREDERVVQAKFLLDHFDMSRVFRVSELAREVGMSPSHLNRLFIKEYGMSLRAIYDAQRKQGVLDDLARTQLPFKEIAYLYAFHDAAAFSNWVKKHTGQAPRALREKAF